MSIIETPESNDQEEKLEEEFFLIYHMHISPSEAETMSLEKRKWLIERYITQKKMEKEVMEQMRRGVNQVPGDFLKELERTRNG